MPESEASMKNVIPLVIATRNPGKTAEIRDLLTGFAVEIKALDDFGPIPEIQEDGQTFDENASKKASFTAKILGIPALADDSGLVVEALGGAPGVFSARYAGENATDEQRCHKLLKEMEGKTNRKANCQGLVAEAPVGQNGFGYDPIFFYPPLKKTFAQLTREEKSRVSHRGKALNEIKAEFDKVLIWMRRQMPLQEKFLHPGD
jgi:XTP/dITP diphosphohydrolase